MQIEREAALLAQSERMQAEHRRQIATVRAAQAPATSAAALQVKMILCNIFMCISLYIHYIGLTPERAAAG